jgi:hypothetical protein
VILFGAGIISEFQDLKKILNLFCISIGMKVNRSKSILLVQGLHEEATGLVQEKLR